MNREPRIVAPTPEENTRARLHCRAALDAAVRLTAAELRDQPLAVKQLMARLLIEDFAALDVNATRDWLDANEAENAAELLFRPGEVRDHSLATARLQRGCAFADLARAEIARQRAS